MIFVHWNAGKILPFSLFWIFISATCLLLNFINIYLHQNTHTHTHTNYSQQGQSSFQAWGMLDVGWNSPKHRRGENIGGWISVHIHTYNTGAVLVFAECPNSSVKFVFISWGLIRLNHGRTFFVKFSPADGRVRQIETITVQTAQSLATMVTAWDDLPHQLSRWSE